VSGRAPTYREIGGLWAECACEKKQIVPLRKKAGTGSVQKKKKRSLSSPSEPRGKTLPPIGATKKEKDYPGGGGLEVFEHHSENRERTREKAKLFKKKS